LLGNGTQTPVSAAANIIKGIPLATQKNRGTVRHGDFYSGRLAVIRVHSCVRSSEQNHENEHVRGTGQGEARHRKYKRLKLGGGQAYDRSSD
jgi:hypothetical protein